MENEKGLSREEEATQAELEAGAAIHARDLGEETERMLEADRVMDEKNRIIVDLGHQLHDFERKWMMTEHTWLKTEHNTNAAIEAYDKNVASSLKEATERLHDSLTDFKTALNAIQDIVFTPRQELDAQKKHTEILKENKNADWQPAPAEAPAEAEEPAK